MTTIEERLRHLADAYAGEPDLSEGLDDAVVRGRRRRQRAGIVTGVGVVAVGTIVGLLAGPGPANVPSIEPVAPASPTEEAGSSTPTPTPSPTPSVSESPSPVPTAAATVAPRPSEQPSARPGPDDEPVVDDFPQPRMLELSVTTDRGTYGAGDPVTITIEACNGTSQPIDEYFFTEGDRYLVRILTQEDRRAIADTSGRSHDGPAVTETWQPGECRTWTEVWDQREGRFDDDGGQQAEAGEYLVQLDWHGVPPPPDGMDPRLYDPAGRDGAASAPFAIEPASPLG